MTRHIPDLYITDAVLPPDASEESKAITRAATVEVIRATIVAVARVLALPDLLEHGPWATAHGDGILYREHGKTAIQIVLNTNRNAVRDAVQAAIMGTGLVRLGNNRPLTLTPCWRCGHDVCETPQPHWEHSHKAKREAYALWLDALFHPERQRCRWCGAQQADWCWMRGVLMLPPETLVTLRCGEWTGPWYRYPRHWPPVPMPQWPMCPNELTVPVAMLGDHWGNRYRHGYWPEDCVADSTPYTVNGSYTPEWSRVNHHHDTTDWLDINRDRLQALVHGMALGLARRMPRRP